MDVVGGFYAIALFSIFIQGLADLSTAVMLLADGGGTR